MLFVIFLFAVLVMVCTKLVESFKIPESFKIRESFCTYPSLSYFYYKSAPPCAKHYLRYPYKDYTY